MSSTDRSSSYLSEPIARVGGAASELGIVTHQVHAVAEAQQARLDEMRTAAAALREAVEEAANKATAAVALAVDARSDAHDLADLI